MLAALVLPAAFCMAAITPVLLPMLYGHEFAPAVPAAAILVCVAGIGVANSMATNLVYALERSDFVFYTSAVGGVLAISAALVLVPRWGLMGAAVGRAAVQLAMVAAGVSFVWYRLGFHASIRSLTRIVIASSLSAAVAWLAIACVPAPLSLALALVGGGLTYLVLLVVLQAFSRDELDLMAHVVRTLPPSIGGIAARILSLFSIAAGGLPPAAWRRSD